MKKSESNKKTRKKGEEKIEREKISEKKEIAKVERNDEEEILMEREKSSSREKD